MFSFWRTFHIFAFVMDSTFVVSARKYRPATFASVVGQRHITSTLKNAIERQQLAHAYLFCGPRGVGKTTCARIFAKAINCLNPNGAEACNECESCRSFNENRSLNIHELDAASNNSVDDIRTLIEQVRIIPQVGRYSVFIIDEVHMLSAAAFNAFLKTLEEPPAHAIFILATTEKHKIIPTILSRCQIYDFNRIRVEDSVEYLKYIAQQEGVSYDDESLNLIAQKADGGMRDALSMFDKAVSFCGAHLNYHEVAQTLNVLDYDTYFSLTDMLLAGDYKGALMAFDTVLGKGFSAQTFVAGLNRHMRDLLVAKDKSTLPLIEMTGSLLARYEAQAAKCSPEFLFGGISLLTESDGRLRLSSNQRLLVELSLMKIAGLGQKKNSLSEDYPLADFTADSATPQATPSAVTTPQVQSVTPVTEPKRETPQVKATIVESKSEQPAEAEAQSPQQPTAATVRRPRKYATSLSALLGKEQEAEQETESDDSAAQSKEDPAAERKLNECRTIIFDDIRTLRPRFVAAFDNMRFGGSTIFLKAPSQALYDEIMRSKTEILMRIAEIAHINGALYFDITVDETIKSSRPIKLEDRVKFLTDKNPALGELRKALDLEVE